MFSIIIKGERNPKNIELVKLKMIFYKTGHVRAEKVLCVTGFYSDWQKDKQRFIPNSADNISKNSLLQKEKLKYLKVAEKWEYSGKNWIPVEWSHFYDQEKEIQNRYTTVSDIIDQMIEINMKRIRIRNGRTFTCESAATKLKYLKSSLERFVKNKYRREFSKLQFRDIDEKFLCEYVIHEKQRGAKNGNRGGVCSKLHVLHDVVELAQKKKLFNVNLDAFDCVKNQMQQTRVVTKAVSHETIMKIEQVDRSILRKCEHLYLDLFLFSYYAGGMSGIDICFLERHSIKGDVIEYERIKSDKRARVILTDKAVAMMKKYRKLSYMNFVFPVFKRKDMSQRHMYDRVGYLNLMVGRTVRKVCAELGIKEHITWGTARSSFITKMLDEGYNVYQVAEMTGNSPATIYKNYYGITNRDCLKEGFNAIF